MFGLRNARFQRRFERRTTTSAFRFSSRLHSSTHFTTMSSPSSPTTPSTSPLKSVAVKSEYWERVFATPYTPVEMTKLKYVISGPTRNCLLKNFKRRGWTDTSIESWNWDLLWYSIGLNGLFRFVAVERLKPNQFINHFPKHRELTHKDRLTYNLQNYKKKLVTQSSKLREELDFLPRTYTLPRELNLLKKNFNSSPLWIIKPNCKARGKGIQIVNDLPTLEKLAVPNEISRRFVVSKYINNPLLLDGRKFDLRLYVLVRSFQPMIAYVYHEGFARVCNSPYTNDPSKIEDLQAHLTNIAVQKQFGDVTHNKILVSDLQLLLQAEFGRRATTQLFKKINKIIYHSLFSCKGLIDYNPQCFELFGYDILIDQNLKPWLIEVNASPSLNSTSKSDYMLKTALINDVFNIVMPSEKDALPKKYGITMSQNLGGFKVLIDQTKMKNLK